MINTLRFNSDIPYDDGHLPVTPLENYSMLLRGETPLWIPTASDEVTIYPRISPDNLAFGIISDAPTETPDRKGGPDMFGVEWVFVEMVGGSMPVEGPPLLEDANEWPEKVKFPNLDDWDWEGNSAKLRPLMPANKMKIVDICCGLFERLISFMDFAGAAVAVIDDEQKDAVHALFSKLCDLYDDMIDRYQKYYGVDMIMFHDDWGSQRAPFFSLATCREMLVPYLKRVVESAHKRGMWFYFHSCGKNEMMVPAMLEAGVDLWKPQPMNDHAMLLETYDGKLVFPGRFDEPDPNASPEKAYEDAKAVLARFKGHKNVTISLPPFFNNAPAMPLYAKAFYELSREQYAEK